MKGEVMTFFHSRMFFLVPVNARSNPGYRNGRLSPTYASFWVERDVGQWRDVTLSCMHTSLLSPINSQYTVRYPSN